MIGLKAVQSYFAPTRDRDALFYARIYPIAGGLSKGRILCLCTKSRDSDPGSSQNPNEGDTRKQELLARIAMLQTQKVRLTDYLDERSAYLTQFAQEADAEFDKIGEDALKGLDEAGARIMKKVESQMQAFEESADANRREIEKNEDGLAAFQGQMEKDLNEGLFFKSLRQSPPVEKGKAKEEARKIEAVTTNYAASKTRRNVYLALLGLLFAAIADSFLSATPDWRKVAILGAIMVPLLTQFLYEQSIVSEKEKADEGKGTSEDGK